jgi:hypothetical protein
MPSKLSKTHILIFEGNVALMHFEYAEFRCIVKDLQIIYIPLTDKTKTSYTLSEKIISY